MRILFVLALVFTVSPVSAQNIFAPTFNPFSVCGNPSQYADQKVRDILSVINANRMPTPPFRFCKNPYVPNAYAQAYQVQALPPAYVQTAYRIDYNPAWFGQSDVAVGNDWALIGVIAHEIGHLQHFGQLNNPYAANPLGLTHRSAPSHLLDSAGCGVALMPPRPERKAA